MTSDAGWVTPFGRLKEGAAKWFFLNDRKSVKPVLRQAISPAGFTSNLLDVRHNISSFIRLVEPLV